MKSVRVGVVGVGSMGRVYADAIQSIDGLELAAVCNRTLAKIQDLPGEKFSNHRDMIASGRVDAVVIATPHWSHPEVAIDALKRGLHVLTDKPLAVHVADGRRVLAAHVDKSRPLRRHLQRANAPRKRQDPIHDRDRRARSDPSGDLARHRPVPSPRLLRERRVAGDLGRRRRGSSDQPGPPRSGSPAMVHGASRSSHREDRTRQVPPHRGGGRRHRRARVSGRRHRALRRDDRRGARHQPGGDRRGQGEAGARYRERQAQVLQERGADLGVQPDHQRALRPAAVSGDRCVRGGRGRRPREPHRHSRELPGRHSRRQRRSWPRRRRRSGRWRSATRCSCPVSWGGPSNCPSMPS